jgi:hypothetical protein
MTTHDSEIDVLLRRHAEMANGVKDSEHLDADELNTFAEGVLPAAARSRYVSHLVDCDDCRRAVTELAAASGVLEPTRLPASESTTESWWQRIAAILSPATLRYAAFAAVLIAVVGIGFGIWQKSHRTPAEGIAQNDRTSDAETQTASKPQKPAASEIAPSQSPAIARGIAVPTPPATSDQKQLEASSDNPPPPPKPADALARNETVPSTANTQGNAASNNAVAPSYAPPPPAEAESNDARSREQQSLAQLHGPRRGESNEKSKSMDDQARAGGLSKGRDEDRARVEADQPVAKEETKNGPAARKRSESPPASLASRQATNAREDNSKSDKAGPPEEADTRSVGGRKFTRQGNAWIDTKLKSSMSIKTISRGSEDFEKLDSGLRSIAQQFSGPVVVVWKGKAYRIQ